MKIIKETCTKGVNIYLGNTKRQLLNKCVDILINNDFTEIQIIDDLTNNVFKKTISEDLIWNFEIDKNNNLI